MKVFALGIGECGRRIGLELFRMTSRNTLENMNKMHVFSLVDLADSETQLNDAYKMDISKSDVSVFYPTTEGLPAGHNLFIGRMKPLSGERGVGGLWFHSKAIAEEAWDSFYETFKHHLIGNEWYSVFHSGGGGTGCGAGPVFLEKIYAQFRGEKLFSEDLYTATLVLPHENWQAWRKANSAAAIGRHAKIAHGIIIADNLQADNLVEKAPGDMYSGSYYPRDLINKRLAEIWISMQMTNMVENEPEPKVHEAADYRRLISNDSYAGVLVPCFNQYALTDFLRGDLNLKAAVFDTMKNHQLAAFELGSFKNLVVVVTFPSEAAGLAGYIVESLESRADVEDMLIGMYGGHLDPSVIFVHSESVVNSVKVTVLVKDPYIPRFLDFYKELKTIVENPDEMTKMISKMFPKDFDTANKNRIMESAREEFKIAYHSFSRYLHAQGYDNIGERKYEII